MRNIISVGVKIEDDVPIAHYICYENIDTTEDTVWLRIYAESADLYEITLSVTSGGHQAVEHNVYFNDGIAEYQLDLTEVSAQYRSIYIRFKNSSYQSDYDVSVTFNDFAPATGQLLIDQWQKKMQIYLTLRYPLYTHFEAWLNAAVSVTNNATAGAGIAVDDKNELSVDLGEGLEFDEDGKIKLSDGKQVESIAVRADSSDKVTNITITYDDESTASYAVTYDANDHVTAFGNVPITWSS